jgi:hypothetical protein
VAEGEEKEEAYLTGRNMLVDPPWCRGRKEKGQVLMLQLAWDSAILRDDGCLDI